MSVAQKLNQVMQTVSNIAKDGINKQQHYTYLSEEAIVNELHQAFTDAGLTIRPMQTELVAEGDYVTSGGTIMHMVRLAVTYQLIDKDDKDEPDGRLVQVIGEGSDPMDKAVNKAMTAAYKYALRQTCMIATGDDPDHTNSENTTRTQQTQTARQRTAKPVENHNAKLHAMAQEAFGADKAGVLAYKQLKTELFGKNIKTPDLTPAQAEQVASRLGAILDTKAAQQEAAS